MLFLLGFVIFLVSIVFAMMGLGGGMLHVPLLIWFGYSLKSVAQPIGLLLNGLTAITAAFTYARKSMIDWRLAWPLALVTAVTAFFGSYTAKYIPDEVLIILFVVIIFIVLLRTILTLKNGGQKDFTELSKKRFYIAIVATAGITFISAMLGLGGGSLIVPLLIWLSYPTKRAAALSSFVVAVSSVAAFAGRVDDLHASWPMVILLCATVIVGARLGSLLMIKKIKPQYIQYGYVLLLITIAVKLLVPYL
ncbi:MAG: sulfite exporter TauE/SafE family protein [Firmicutes bacterium]|nr:sulfite exporter TauE/SafE family protein [Bacillota bacterium]